MWRFVWLVLIVVFVLRTTVTSDELSCALYIAPSKVPGAGRGIFAGKSFSVEEFIEQDPSITMSYHHSSLTSLAHYVYSCNDDEYSMINFGVGCLFNFIPSRVSVNHFWAEDVVSSGTPAHTLPYANSTHVYFQTTRSCSTGEELYVSYGDSWFEEREMFDNVDVDPSYLPEDTFSYSQEELQDQGICLSDVMIASSSIPDANLGLHAFRSFQKGELITVSPVLVLPMSVVEDSVKSSVLMNYVWTEPGAKLGLFPLSHVAMINHASKTATNEEALVTATANVEVTWFDWFQFSAQGGRKHSMNATFKPDNLEMSYDIIVDTPFAPLDIAIYASRDIALGEELFLDYGAEWENAWQTWLFNDQNSIAHFRHPVHLPQGMLPRHWFEDQTSFSTFFVNSSDEQHLSDETVSTATSATTLHSDL